jgi:transcriptional/translational regulatory protein YebC/TACO1
LDKARAANMPKDKMQRAIDRGTGKSSSGVHLQEIVYEGFGSGGVAVLAVATTDNPNRTAGDVRFIFSKAGGSLAGPGSASYMFTRDPGGSYVCNMPIQGVSEADVDLIENLVDTLLEHDDIEDVYTSLPEESPDEEPLD